MRIALLTDGIYPYVIGGMQKHSFFLVKFFAQHKIHVDLYHMNRSSFDIEKLEFFSEEEKKYIRSFVFSFPKTFPFPGHYNKESYLHSCLLYDEFKKHPLPDFIYAKGYAGWKFMEEKKKGAALPPIGVRLHGYEVFQPTRSLRVKFWNALYLKTFRYNNIHADFVYSYGGKITGIIRDNLQIDPSKIISVPTGIEASWLNDTVQSPHNPVRFIFVGRYDIRKGIAELNKALQELRQTHTFEFHFVGPVPEKHRISAPFITYHGPVSDGGKIKLLLQQSDVLVLPSHSEGMPNVIMEAMASGCAVIATDVGAVHLMVGDENGLLIPPFSPSAIAAAMASMIDMPDTRLLKKKEASRDKVADRFLWEKVILEEIASITKITGTHEA